MLKSTYIQPVINALLLTTSLLLGVATFGVPLVFDCISIVLFCLFAYLFRHNGNIVGVCIILVLENIGINLYDLAHSQNIELFTIEIQNILYVDLSNTLAWKFIAYAFATVVFMFLRYDRTVRYILPFLVFSITAEIYWLVIDYPAPAIQFYFVKISGYLLVRHFLHLRGHHQEHFPKSTITTMQLDWLVQKTKALACYLECAMVSEYLLRHLFNIHALLFYNIYEYVMQALAIWVFWLVFREAVKLHRLTTLPA
jgi:hypothetical protein